MKTETKIEEKKILHIGFEIGLLLKSVFAAFEVLSGILLIFITPERLNQFINILVREELQEDPKDLIAHYLVVFGQSFSVSAQQFGVFYLISHGIIKLVVLFLLWKKKLWAYPLSIAVFLGFIAYQVYRFTFTHSIGLLLLTLLDLVMIWLTIVEYNNAKQESCKT